MSNQVSNIGRHGQHLGDLDPWFRPPGPAIEPPISFTVIEQTSETFAGASSNLSRDRSVFGESQCILQSLRTRTTITYLQCRSTRQFRLYTEHRLTLLTDSSYC